MAIMPLIKRAARGCLDATQLAKKRFSELEAWLSSRAALQSPLHIVEHKQEQKGREAQQLMLQAHVQQQGNGDVGSALRVVVKDCEEMRYTHRRVRTRRLKTIFGEITIVRMGYFRKSEESIYPLDEILQLPARSFSYELQRRMVKAAVQGPFDEVKERMEEISGMRIPKRSLEEVIENATEDFDDFYANRISEPSSQTATILVAAVDSKGIPMVKRQGAQRMVRPGKGKKANTKKMATAATVFTRQPWVRKPEDVMESLFRSGPRNQTREENDRPNPENKRVWASLVKGKSAVIAEVAEEMHRRDPGGKKIHVALTDGERTLQNWPRNISTSS